MHLKKAAGSAHLLYEELYTLLVQIKATMNSLLLSADPNDYILFSDYCPLFHKEKLHIKGTSKKEDFLIGSESNPFNTYGLAGAICIRKRLTKWKIPKLKSRSFRSSQGGKFAFIKVKIRENCWNTLRERQYRTSCFCSYVYGFISKNVKQNLSIIQLMASSTKSSKFWYYLIIYIFFFILF